MKESISLSNRVEHRFKSLIGRYIIMKNVVFIKRYLGVIFIFIRDNYSKLFFYICSMWRHPKLHESPWVKECTSNWIPKRQYTAKFDSRRKTRRDKKEVTLYISTNDNVIFPRRFPDVPREAHDACRRRLHTHAHALCTCKRAR